MAIYCKLHIKHYLVIWSAEIKEAHLTDIESDQSQEAESSAQKCSVELTSNQMQLVDRLVDMNRCIGLTGNKLLYPLRHEAISLASIGFHRRRTECKTYRVYFFVSIQAHAAGCQPAFFSWRMQREIKTLKTGSHPGHTPGPQEHQ